MMELATVMAAVTTCAGPRLIWFRSAMTSPTANACATAVLLHHDEIVPIEALCNSMQTVLA